jgi:hypothetical protein
VGFPAFSYELGDGDRWRYGVASSLGRRGSGVVRRTQNEFIAWLQIAKALRDEEITHKEGVPELGELLDVTRAALRAFGD